MLFYIIIGFFIYIYNFKILENGLKNYDKKIYFVIIISLICLGGMRWNTGTDWISYRDFFLYNYSIRDFIIKDMEPGFGFFNYLIKKVFNSYTIFLIIFSAITISLKVITINKYSAIPFMSLYLYYCYYLGDIFAVRNALAASICIFSIRFIANRKFIYFSICLFFATFIHYSSLVWFFAYFIYERNLSNKFFICFFLLCLTIGFFAKEIMHSIIYLLINNLDFIITNNGLIYNKLIYYIEDYRETLFTFEKVLFTIVKRAIIFPIFLFFRKRIDKKSNFHGILNIYFIGNSLYMLFLTYLHQFSRTLIPFIFTEVLLLPRLYVTLEKKRDKYLFLFLVVIYGNLKILSFIYPYRDILIPYYSIFNYVNRVMR